MSLVRLKISCCVLFMLGVTSNVLAAGHPKMRNFDLPHVPGEAIVIPARGFKATQVAQLITEHGGTIKSQLRASRAFVVRFTDGSLSERANFASTLHTLANEPSIASLEANFIIKLDTVPNDARFSELYALQNSGQSGGVAGADIKVTQAWDVSTGSRKVLVGVIDTGINYNHPDIAPNYWTNAGEMGTDAEGKDRSSNGIDDDNNGFIDDFRGWDFANNDNDPMDDNSSYHGTHCAGTIGANGNDGSGVVGVNWQVSLVAIKFITAAGSGTLEGAVQAIEYGTKLGVDLTSNSWGGGGASDVMAAAIAEAQQRGIIFVAAAGNSGSNNDESPHFPSSYEHENIISVAATDRRDQLASFSCYGPTSVDLAAPGVDILSTSTGDTFKSLSGTSMATPHVAGAVALIKSVYPKANYQQIKRRLMYGADQIAASAATTRSGGRLNVAAAIEADSVAPGAVDAVQTMPLSRNSVRMTFAAAGDDGHDGRASSYEIRYAAQPIDSEDAWQAAALMPVNAVWSEGAQAYVAEIQGLPLNSQGFAAVRAYDNVGNVGAISVSTPAVVKPVKTLFVNAAETLEGLEVQGTWATEEVAGGNGLVFSDSPGAVTASSADMSVTFPVMDAVVEKTLAIEFRTKTDLERGYDFGYVEIRKEGDATWTKLKVITGQRDWRVETADLPASVTAVGRFQLRLHLTTDSSINNDGWFVDDISIIAE